MAHWTASLVLEALHALRNRPEKTSKWGAIYDAITDRPLKAIAAYIFAPFLLLRLAWRVKSPTRRFIACFGILASMLAAYIAGTLFGGLAGAFLIAIKIGLIWGLAFFVGTYLSVMLTVCFQVVVFNMVTLIFLRMSQEDVSSYLEGLCAA